MNSLPLITLLTKDDYKHYRHFFSQCIEYSLPATFSRTQPPSKYSQQEMESWFNDGTVYLCNRNNKNIGFVLIDIKETTEQPFVQASFFIHPNVCKLASITLARATSVIVAYTMAENSAKGFFSTIHGVTLTTFSDYLDVSILKQTPYYFSSLVLKEDTFQRIKDSFEEEDLEPYTGLFKINHDFGNN